MEKSDEGFKNLFAYQKAFLQAGLIYKLTLKFVLKKNTH